MKTQALKMNLFVFIAGLLIPCLSLAADHCVRSGLTYNGNGSTWAAATSAGGAGAYNALPATLVRGDTYYLADGDYGTYIFDDTISGTQYITIKKAIATNHGPISGWDNSYGDGQAVFTRSTQGNTIEIRTAYYIIDGQTGGGPSSWTSGYGVKITATGTSGPVKLLYLTNAGGGDIHHIDISHVDFFHRGQVSLTMLQDDAIYEVFGAIPLPNTPQSPRLNTHHITISYCAIRNTQRTNVLTGRSSYWTFDHVYFADNINCNSVCAAQRVALYGGVVSDYEQHSESIASYGTSHYVIKHCMFADIYGTANIGLKENYDENFDSWEIYGNVFFRRDTSPSTLEQGMGTIANTSTATGGVTNFKIYNNTFVNIAGLNSGINFQAVSANNLVYNNLWYNCVKAGFLKTTHDYNYFINTPIAYGSSFSSHETIGMGNPFSNTATEDYKITRLLTPSIDLPSPYDYDGLGNRRKADGIWDIGAYEYNDSSITPSSPSGLKVLIQN